MAPRILTRHQPTGLTGHCARWTGPREEIFNVLVQTQRHLTAKDVFALLRPTCPDIGLTTVYRTLDLLNQAGLARKVMTGDGQVRFEYRRADRSDHHHHLICSACGMILNYSNFEQDELDLVRRTEAALAKKHGFLIRDHNIEFLGLCPACRPGGERSVIAHNADAPVQAPQTRGRRSSRKASS
jgi:Fur family ferric uptake transcriptional regulator